MEDKNYVTYFTRDDFDDKYHDNIRFVSKTDDRVEFEVYAYNEKTQVWFLVGTAHLSHYDDTCFVDVDVRGFRLSKYNYFAVRPLKKKTYAYSYDGAIMTFTLRFATKTSNGLSLFIQGKLFLNFFH